MADCDAATGRVTELGGRVQVEPTDIHAGRSAVVADPHGAPFGLFQGQD